MTIETRPQAKPAAVSTEDRIAALHAIDTDVHNDLPSYAELKPFLARQWYPWIEDGRPAFAERAYANTGSGRMDDAVREEDNLAAGDPEWVIQQLLTSISHRYRSNDRDDDRREHPARPALLRRADQCLQR